MDVLVTSVGVTLKNFQTIVMDQSSCVLINTKEEVSIFIFLCTYLSSRIGQGSAATQQLTVRVLEPNFRALFWFYHFLGHVALKICLFSLAF